MTTPDWDMPPFLTMVSWEVAVLPPVPRDDSPDAPIRIVNHRRYGRVLKAVEGGVLARRLWSAEYELLPQTSTARYAAAEFYLSVKSHGESDRPVWLADGQYLIYPPERHRR